MCDRKTTIADKLEHKKQKKYPRSKKGIVRQGKCGLLAYALSILQLSGGMSQSK
jgi:hypothetical protein